MPAAFAAAFTAALGVAGEAALAGVLALLVVRPRRPRLAHPLAAAPLLGACAGLAAGFLAVRRGASPADVAIPLARLRQLVALALLAAAWFARRAAPPRGRASAAALDVAALAGGALLVFPEGVGLAAVLRDAVVLAGSAAPVVGGAAAGLATAGVAGALAAALLARSGAGAVVSPRPPSRCCSR